MEVSKGETETIRDFEEHSSREPRKKCTRTIRVSKVRYRNK